MGEVPQANQEYQNSRLCRTNVMFWSQTALNFEYISKIHTASQRAQLKDKNVSYM